jgi:hypothetical protein
LSKEKVIKDQVSAIEFQTRKGPFALLPVPDPENDVYVAPCSPERVPGQIKAQIIKWYYERIPWYEIEERLHHLGYVIPEKEIEKWATRSTRSGAEVTDALELDELRLKMEQRVVYGLMDVIFEALGDMKVPKAETPKDFEMLCSAAAKLVSSIAQRERVELEKAVMVDKVRDWLKKEFQRLMAGKPELVEQVNQLTTEVYGVIDQASVNVKKIAIDV